MKRKKPGIFRGLSLLLALLIVVNLPISAFAADATQESDIVALASDVPDEMLNSAILRALLYLGYDADNYLRSNDLLFTSKYIGNSLNSNRPSALTGIPYANGGGRAEKTATTAQEKADTKTGRVPNISAFQTNGMVCTSFIEYYYLNYLKNIEGEIDKVKTIANAYEEALELCNSNSSKYPDAWSTTGNLLTSSKYDNFARKTELDLEYAMDSTSDEFAEFFDSLPIGALVQFGGDDPSYWLNDYIHYAVYAGCYNGEYYIIHVANSRGPEITLAKNMAKSSNKKSYPIAAYEFDAPKQFGAVEVFKANPNNKPLANAVFALVNKDTGEDYTLVTGIDGTARIEDLLIDCEYTLTEVTAPPGYEIAEKHQWTFTLTAEQPTFSVAVTNTPKKGSLKIIKNILPSSAATSGNLAGWQFNIYKNSPTYTTTIRDGVIYRVKVTDKNGNFIYSDPAELMVEEKESVEEPPIEITAQPSNVALSSGSTASFTVAAKSNTGKTLTYQWYYKNPTATSWSKSTSASATTATYSLSINSDRDGRGAMCLISDGTNEIWSDPAYMYLTGSLGINKNPGNQTAAYGATATFSATYYGTPTGYTWQYSADGNTWMNCSDAPFSCTGYNTASLKVTSAQAINGYQFRCVVTNGSKTYQTLGATLTAIPAYISFISPSASALVNIGQKQSFYVGVNGSNLTYQWQIWTAETGEWVDLEGMVSSGMTLTMTKEYSNSKVRAKVTQGDTVLYSDPVVFATPDSLCILSQPSVLPGDADSDVTLSVSANGDGLVYQWEMYDAANDKWISVDQQFGGTRTTDNKGVVQVDNLPIGDYYVVEIDTGREGWGYDLTPKAVTVTEDNTAELPYEVTITNELLQGSVSIDKLTEDGENYPGWKFAIYADAECTILIDEDLTDEDGYWLFEGLAPGTYWVKELGHVDPAIDELYYCASENPQMVTVQAGKIAQVEFENKLNYGDIEIIKKGNNDKILSGAVFEAKDSKGNVYTFTESAENPGHYFLNHVLYGTYTITEITPPEGYEIGEQNEWVVTLGKSSPDGKATLTVVNIEILGELVIKKETEDGKNLGGWIFNVYADEGCSILLAGPFKTDANGNINNLPGLKPGTVWVKEEGHENQDIEDLYYCNSNNPQRVEIVGHKTATVTFENKLNRGDIEIIKKGDNGKLLSGAGFQAVDADGNIFYFEEDANRPGYYYLNNVPYGTYTITETKFPEGYEAGSETEWVVTLGKSSPNAMESVTIVNKQKVGTLEIQKNTNTGLNKDGWLVNVYFGSVAEENLLSGSPFTTDADGKIVISNLPIGIYIAVEVNDGKEMWIYDLEAKSAEVPNGGTGYITITNIHLGYGQIIKDTTNGGTKEGWLFEVKDADGNVLDGSPFTTNGEGKIDLGLLLPGEYTVQEIGHTSMTAEQLLYWTQATEPQILTVEAGATKAVTFLNQWNGKGTIIKTTVNGGSAAGWQFQIWQEGSEPITVTTGDNGEFNLGLLAPGTYYVKEVGHETYDLRYWIMDTEVKTLTVKAGETASVSFENVWMGELVIDKQAVNSDLLEGWIGDLYLVNPDGTETRIGSYVSDENGIFAELLVAPGKYIFRETGHTDSSVELKYWVMSDAVEVEVTAGATTPATIINTELGNGQIFKDTTNNGIKEGWQFKVWTDGAEIGIFVTDENGSFDSGLLAPGTYYVQEIGHSSMTAEQLAYWVMDTEVKTLVVTAGTTTGVHFENQWLGYGQIKKEMPDGGSVAGWIFDVYREGGEGAYIGEFTSDENGDIALGYLIPGEYRVIERVPEGSLYQPVGGNEKILTVIAGEVSSLTVRNTLKSGEIILNKLDSSDDKALAGAKFLLEWLDGDVWKPVILSDTVIPGGCRSEGLVNGCLVTGSNGQIIFEGLHPDLEYRLTEVEAPDGYTLQSAPVFEGKLPADTLSKEVTAYNSGIFDIPETGDNSYLNVLVPFVAIVVCVFLTMVALAIKEGMLTEIIRKYKK